MKIIRIYEEVEKYRSIPDSQKVYDWIWKVDRDIEKNLIEKSVDVEHAKIDKYIFGDSDELETITPEEYADMYVYYVLARIDLLYQDNENYTNNMILFNNTYKEYAAEFRAMHRQKADYKIYY